MSCCRVFLALLVVVASMVAFVVVVPQPAPKGQKAAALMSYGDRDLSFFQQRPWWYEKEEYAEGKLSLKGKTAIVTGSSSGIGLAVALELYRLGCDVTVTSRSIARSESAIKKIKDQVGFEGDGSLQPAALDLSDLESVEKFSREFRNKHHRLDFLSANAGMAAFMLGWTGPWLSKQNYEMLYAGNYLGHFLLVQSLLPLLKKSEGRISATNSIGHWTHDEPLDKLLPSAWLGKSTQNYTTGEHSNHYGNTKIAQVMMCFEMQRRIPEIPCTPVTPGFINTAIMNQDLEKRDGSDGSWGVFTAKAPTDGALTTLHALLDKHDGEEHGVFLQPYYLPLHQSNPLVGFTVFLWEILGQGWTWGLYRWAAHPDAYNVEFAKKLWDESMKAVAGFV
jgi:NAD(P)-dependent dehydrogenase (short-subunit alcohol dehydrogenase family)